MRVGLFVAAFVIAAVAMLTSTPARAADGCFPPAGYMRSIQGQVEIKRGAADWRPAALDDPLCAGDLIRVGDRSRALAAIANLAKRINQNTTLSLTYVPEDKPAVVGLIEGAVYFFSRKPRVLQVDTPFFDAAIEGTEFLVRVEPRRAQLTVFDGRITARNAQGELTVASGQSLAAEAGQAPAPYVLVRPRDAVQWALFYPVALFPLADRSGMAARDIPGLLGEAVELASRGEFAAAFARFGAIPEVERGAEFYLYRAATLLSVGRVEDARADIDQALARDPNDGRAYALSAVIAVAQNERDRALTDAQRGVELSPRSAAAKIVLSYAEQAQFRIEQARDTMKQAVQDEPENALAWARLSELWLMLGYRGRALKAAKKARKLAPELERVETVLGFAALATIDTTKAKQAFRRAITLNSADPQARFGLGLATIRDGNLEEGRGEIELAVGLDPENSLLRSYLGKAYFDERTTDPLTYFKELVSNFPNQENTLAAEQFAIAKRLDPQDPTPYLYDAIRKQSENRPVEALRDIEKSIELNDNRAVYRSRELLDQDQASRGTSLARIYNDLGFEQLGINEATKSLSYDPSNAGAHRFLSDVYATRPRSEIARASELLQAQLLQDININPVQPSLAETNLGIITGGGPARPGFNEFTPLFERNQAQLNVTGVIGNHGTYADEAVISGIYDQFSVSAGQFDSHTNGFRRNADSDSKIYNFFAQAAATPNLNLQAEIRQRSTEQGDLQLNFSSEDYSESSRRRIDQNTGRFGLRFSPAPHSNFIASLIYSNRDASNKEILSGFDGFAQGKQKGFQGEAQYLLNTPIVDLVSGINVYSFDTHAVIKLSRNERVLQSIFDRSWTPEQRTYYMYNHVAIGRDARVTIGYSYDDFADKKRKVMDFNPKLGLEWYITDDLLFRCAAFQTVKPALIVMSQTIQPTQVAGFNQFYDDRNGTKSRNYGVALDSHVAEGVYIGVEFSQRDLDAATTNNTELPFVLADQREDIYLGYLYFTLDTNWAAHMAIQMDNFRSSNEAGGPPLHVDTFSIPISLRYFDEQGFFGSLGVTYIRQNVVRSNGSGFPKEAEGNSNFAVVDAGIGYRFPKRRGLASIDVMNIFDKKLKFQDDSFREVGRSELRQSPYIPERTVLGRVTLNF